MFVSSTVARRGDGHHHLMSGIISDVHNMEDELLSKLSINTPRLLPMTIEDAAHGAAMSPTSLTTPMLAQVVNSSTVDTHSTGDDKSTESPKLSVFWCIWNLMNDVLAASVISFPVRPPLRVCHNVWQRDPPHCLVLFVATAVYCCLVSGF